VTTAGKRLPEILASLAKKDSLRVAFVFETGAAFASTPLTEEERAIVAAVVGANPSRAQLSFENAEGVLQADATGTLDYVEGYVCSDGVGLKSHAWIAIGNKVVEPDPETEYYGIRIGRADVQERIAWLKRLIMERQPAALVVRAWGRPNGAPKAPPLVPPTWETKPYMLLERVAIHADGTVEFRAFDGWAKPRTPLLSKMLQGEDYSELSRQLSDGWVLMDGSSDPWTIVRKVEDANADGQIVLFLRADKAPGP
jgi:hypothetical protein